MKEETWNQWEQAVTTPPPDARPVTPVPTAAEAAFTAYATAVETTKQETKDA